MKQLLLLVGMVLLAGCAPVPQDKFIGEYPLVALALNHENEMHGGGSFLGWNVDAEGIEYLAFIYRDGDTCTIKKVPGRNAKVVIDNQGPPRVRMYSKPHKSFVYPGGSEQEGMRDIYYVPVVPESAITKRMEIDIAPPGRGEGR
jgi:hypothetical protein